MMPTDCLVTAFSRASVIEFRIECVEILAVKTILYDPQTFTKSLVMHNFTFPKESDRIRNFRILYQTEDIVIGRAGFLFWGDFVRTTLHNII